MRWGILRHPKPFLLACLLAFAVPAFGQTASKAAGAEEAASTDSMVFIVSPEHGKPAFGEITVEVEAFYPEVERVVVWIDGREALVLDRVPFRGQVSLGGDYGSHEIEAIAFGPGGELGRALRVTPAIAVDESIDLALQQLYVSIESEVPAAELTVADFEIRDQGVDETIVTFEGGDAALTVAVLIDASSSMAGGRLAAALGGAGAFLNGMQDLDEASVVLFADGVRSRSLFSQSPAELVGELSSARAGGGTAINDALYRALRELEDRQGRRVVVLLSDGVDIHSALEISDVLWVARRSRSIVYWIELRDAGDSEQVTSAWRNREAHLVELEGLRQLVRETGGRVVRIAGAGEAAGAFADILAELREQYVLGYYPTVDANDGRWHEVRVRVRRPGLKIRTRGGYVDY